MDSHSIILLVTILFLVMMSAYFSATETAFNALNKVRMKNMAQDGNRKAKLTLKLNEDYDKLISTILIGNNIVNILAASLGTVLFTRIYGDIGVTISTIFITVVVLIFGEIFPKSIAKESPEKFAMFSSSIIRVFVFILTPLNFIFTQLKKLLNIFRKPDKDQGITEDELITYVDEAENDGGINSEESELIRSAIEFNDIEVDEILTPRVDLIAIEENEDMQKIGQLFRLNGFSRFPVYRGSIDTIIGVLHEKDFYDLLYKGADNIKSEIQNVVCTTGGTKISTLLKRLQQEKTHMAVVVDEFGGTEGIVTMEDIIEELVGEIWDEHDEVVELYRQVGEHKYIVSGTANLDDALEAVGMKDCKTDYDTNTVNGWVLEEFGGIPREGDSFIYKDAKITVTQIDFRRVKEVVIEKIEIEEENPKDKKDEKNKKDK